MAEIKRQRRPQAFRWPPYPLFTFYTGRGKVVFQESDANLDLADTLMLHWPNASRTIHMGLASNGKSWATWTEERLRHVEKLITYDLGFDGYAVRIDRLTDGRRLPCKREFRWKLQIRTRF